MLCFIVPPLVFLGSICSPIPNQEITHLLPYEMSHTIMPYNNTSIGAKEKPVETKQLKITINSIKINNDHDPLYGGEWRVNVYVNDHLIPLWQESGYKVVNTGDTINFTNKSTVITIPKNETLRIVTTGVEYDSSKEDLMNVSGLLKDQITFKEDISRVQDSVQSLIAFGRNDAIGIIQKEYPSEINYGIGSHDDCSEANQNAGDLFAVAGTSCDYRLRYTIEDTTIAPNNNHQYLPQSKNVENNAGNSNLMMQKHIDN